MPAVSDSLFVAVGASLVVFVAISFGLAWWYRDRIHDAEDFLVAGRRLPLSLAWATLLATWFGAGTLLTAADEIANGGLQRAALEPLGAGLCLILAGVLLARPLWEMKLLTFGDFFGRRFGPRAELVSSLLMIPTYFGWVAVQFIALAGILQLYLGIDPWLGMILVAAVGAGYTLMGGMWAVTMTDAVQLALLLVGLLILGVQVLAHFGDGSAFDGLSALADLLPPAMLEPVPTETASATFGWLSVLATSALGNLAGQDLLQRIFAARDAKTAQRACGLAGATYILAGSIPVMLGLAAAVSMPQVETSVVPALAAAFLSPATMVVFVVTIAAAVLSTIDGALLAPASVFAKNVAPRLWPSDDGGPDLVRVTRICIVATAVISLVLAWIGESAYGLLEDAYELGFTCLVVPLVLGVHRSREQGDAPAVAAMLFGFATWVVHYAAGWETFGGPALQAWSLPRALTSVAIALAIYLVVGRRSASQ